MTNPRRSTRPPTLKNHRIKPEMVLFNGAHHWLVEGVYADFVSALNDTHNERCRLPTPDECLGQYTILDEEAYNAPLWLTRGWENEDVKVRGIHGKHVRFFEKLRGTHGVCKPGFYILPIDIFLEVYGWQGQTRFERNEPV